MTWTLSKQDMESYDRDGFLIVDDAFSQEELTAFDKALLYTVRTYVKQAAKGENPFSRIADMYEEIDLATAWLEEQDHYYIAQIYHAIADIPAFLKLGIKPQLESIAGQLLGAQEAEPLYTLTKRCRIDLPTETSYTFGWHQEVFYSIPKSQFMMMWAPLLRPATVENGTIDVAVGSHKEGVADQDWTMNDGIPNQIIVKDEVVARYEVRPVIIKPGQLVIFSNKLIHRSGENTSGTTRFSLVSSFHRMDSEDFQAARFTGSYFGLDPMSYYRSLLSKAPVATGEPAKIPVS